MSGMKLVIRESKFVECYLNNIPITELSIVNVSDTLEIVFTENNFGDYDIIVGLDSEGNECSKYILITSEAVKCVDGYMYKGVVITRKNEVIAIDNISKCTKFATCYPLMKSYFKSDGNKENS